MGRPSIGASAKNSSQASSVLTTASMATRQSGSGFVIGVIWDNVLATFVSLADNKANTGKIVQIGAELTGGNNTSRYFYIPHGVGGAGHTFTLTISAATLCTIFVAEVLSGVGFGIGLGQHAEGPNDFASPYESASLTVLTGDQMLMAFYADDSFSGTATHTVAGYTVLQEETDANVLWSGCLAARLVNVAGSYNASMTHTATLNSTTPFLAAFTDVGTRRRGTVTHLLDDESGQFESDVQGRNWF